MTTADLSQILLEHGNFVRTLAGRLLDADAADDIAQETWLRVIQHEPRSGGSMRHWLRTVVRNLAGNSSRGEANRRGREQDAARPEALPSAAEESEQVELLGAVVGAVLALEEPYRSTILDRYFRGLSASRLAAASGSPLATVRSREQRALAKLRERLDKRFGSRSSWALALGKGFGSNTAPAQLSLLANVTVKLGLVTAVTIAGGLALRAGWQTWNSALPSEPISTVVEASIATPVRIEPRPTNLTVRTSEAPVRVPVSDIATQTGAATGPSSSAVIPQQTCEIRGRLLLPSGEPSIGQAVQMRGWIANRERSMDFGEPKAWEDPTTITDRSGRFALVFSPPRAFSFELRSKRDGFAQDKWFWNVLLPDDLKDLGEIALRPGGAIEGHVVDADGAPVLLADLEVSVDGQIPNMLRDRTGRQVARGVQDVDPTTGHFRFEDLPAGRLRLKAGSRFGKFGHGWVRGPVAVVIPGETVEADILWDQPDDSRNIVVRTSLRWLHSANQELKLESIRLLGDDREQSPPIERSRGTFVFEDVPTGVYSVEIEDPRFLPWSRSDITPGSVLRARLEGSSALQLDVADEEGTAIQDYIVDVVALETQSYPNRFRLHEGGEPLPGGLVKHLVAGSYNLALTVAGLGTRTVRIDNLRPGETRKASVVFGPPASLAGHVIRPGGNPVEGALVLLLAPAAVADSPASPILRRDSYSSEEASRRHELAETRTDSEGGFRFEMLEPGSYALHAQLDPLIGTATEALLFAGGYRIEGLKLVLPKGGRIGGVVSKSADLRTEEFQVLAWAPNRQSPSAGFLLVETPLGSDGSFEFDPLPAGPITLYLALPKRVRSGFAASGELVSGARKLGTVVVREGEFSQAKFDGSSLSTGSVSVLVQFEDKPVVGVRVALLEHREEEDFEECSALTDLDGRVDLPAFPGTYRIHIKDADRGWNFVDPEALLLGAAQAKSRVIVPVEAETDD